MRVKETGRGLLREAELRLRTAKAALRGRNYAYAFRQAQECVELSLKACLRRVGVEYPRVHDVSRALKASADMFPGWFREKLEGFCRASTELAERREMSMYGDERAGLAPEQLFSEGDAAGAVARASEVLRACRRLHA
jgi:HEPN domain-containing protein